MGISYDDLRGEGLAGKARELILRLQRSGGLGARIARLQRPDAG